MRRLDELTTTPDWNKERRAGTHPRVADSLAGWGTETFRVLDGLPVGILVVNRSGEALFANAAARDLVALRAGDRLDPGADLAGMFVASTDEPYPGHRLPALRALRGERCSVDDLEVRRNGRAVRLLATAVPLSETDGETASAVCMFHDITAHTRMEEQLRQAEERYRLLIEQIPAVPYIDLVDENCTAVYISPRIEEMSGYAAEDWLSDPELWPKILHPDDREWAMASNARHIETKEPWSMEYRLVARDGRTVWVRDEGLVVADPSGVEFFQGILMDITEDKRAEQEIAFLAYHDKLTGLANRAKFEERLDDALSRARRYGSEVAVLYMDLDDFKLVNDTLGHAAGDDLLRQVAARLDGVTRGTDLVARPGGDEFLVLLEGSASAELSSRTAAATAASRIQDSLRSAFDVGGTEVFVTASIGISMFPLDADDVTTLLRNADVAMYQSKKAGPGGFLEFAEGGTDTKGRLALATDLRRAVENEDWILHYQPLVDLATSRMVGVEALIRWPGPGGKMVSPLEFIPMAEEMGLIHDIGEWVVKEACRAVASWQLEGLRLDVSVNLSPKQLWRADLPESLAGHFEAANIPMSNVAFEVTESTFMTDPQRTLATLNELRRRGFRLALDDFGTGYSSLSRLRDMPVQILKIDRAFIRDVVEDRDAQAMVQAIIQLARGLGMTPVAEGIETEDQRRFLLEHGCLFGQGFLFSPGVPAEEISAMAAQQQPGFRQTET